MGLGSSTFYIIASDTSLFIEIYDKFTIYVRNEPSIILQELDLDLQLSIEKLKLYILSKYTINLQYMLERT